MMNLNGTVKARRYELYLGNLEKYLQLYVDNVNKELRPSQDSPNVLFSTLFTVTRPNC